MSEAPGFVATQHCRQNDCENLNPAAVVVQDAGVSNHIAAKPHRGTIHSHEDKGRHKCDEEVHSFVRKSFVSESPYRNTSAAYLL